MSERDWPWHDERLDEMATASQIDRANEAVAANLNEDGAPKWGTAQSFACALTAIMLSDARMSMTSKGRLYAALDAFVRHHREGGRPYTKDLLVRAEAALRGTAIAAGSRRAKTPKAVECEASQSGGEAASPNPQGNPGPPGVRG